MIFGLTGHTKGFGKHIHDYLVKGGHTVIGFSKSNGYDITLGESREEIVNAIPECDVFINNAYCGEGQVLLLDMIYEGYPKKHIINVGADITETDGSKFKKLYENKIKLKNLSKVLGKEYKSWGFWKGHPISKIYPELITNITIEEAIEELLENVFIH